MQPSRERSRYKFYLAIFIFTRVSTLQLLGPVRNKDRIVPIGIKKISTSQSIVNLQKTRLGRSISTRHGVRVPRLVSLSAGDRAESRRRVCTSRRPRLMTGTVLNSVDPARSNGSWDVGHGTWILYGMVRSRSFSCHDN